MHRGQIRGQVPCPRTQWLSWSRIGTANPTVIDQPTLLPEPIMEVCLPFFFVSHWSPFYPGIYSFVSYQMCTHAKKKKVERTTAQTQCQGHAELMMQETLARATAAPPRWTHHRQIVTCRPSLRIGGLTNGCHFSYCGGRGRPGGLSGDAGFSFDWINSPTRCLLFCNVLT